MPDYHPMTNMGRWWIARGIKFCDLQRLHGLQHRLYHLGPACKCLLCQPEV